jgi:hypothetical protein
MARFLVQRDGLFLGSSSAVNLVACVKLVRKMGWGNGEKVVTVLCVTPTALSDLSHCPDANDAINLSWGCPRVKLILGVIRALVIIPRFVCFPSFGPGRRACWSSELMTMVTKKKL